jgi:V8-like Glu-specific endopeptidase
MDKNFLSVSNTGELAEFENKTLPSPFSQVDGLDTNTLEEVQGFNLRNSDWFEKLPDDILTLPHIGSSFSQPENVCGNDDRALVNTQNVPYRYICSLVITAANGSRYIGSGFFISQRCVITSGHCVFMSNAGGWVRSIQVIPGRSGGNAPFGSQVSSNFRSVTGWTQNNNSDFDQGAIILPDNTLFNRIGGYFGYSELRASTILNNSGYPGDKPSGTQWFNAGAPTRVTDYKLEYMIDTAGGQSGSPVFVNSPSRSVVGVHGYGGCPNKAVRVRDYFFQRWPEWSRL